MPRPLPAARIHYRMCVVTAAAICLPPLPRNVQAHGATSEFSPGIVGLIAVPLDGVPIPVIMTATVTFTLR